MAVEGRHVELLTQYGEAPVDGSAAAALGGDLPLVAPYDSPGPGVQCIAVVVGSGQVHDLIQDQRHRLEPGRVPVAGLEDPLHLQTLYVFGVNLIQRTVILTAVVTPIVKPIGWFFESLDQSLGCDLGLEP